MCIVKLTGVMLVISILATPGCRDNADTGIVFGETEIKVGGRTIMVEVALTAPQMEQGLKYRYKLEKDRGMIFIYSRPVHSYFWMKDTHIPLSIAFINPDGIITDIQKMEPDNDQKTYRPPHPFKYALEMNWGWFENHDINVGDRVEI